MISKCGYHNVKSHIHGTPWFTLSKMLLLHVKRVKCTLLDFYFENKMKLCRIFVVKISSQLFKTKGDMLNKLNPYPHQEMGHMSSNLVSEIDTWLS